MPSLDWITTGNLLILLDSAIVRNNVQNAEVEQMSRDIRLGLKVGAQGS